jgi:5-methyltetrahydrofolate--homocysteine methyltransferase
MMASLNQIKEDIISGKVYDIEAVVKSALDEGIEPKQIFDEAFIPGIHTVGDKFQNHELFLPEMILAATTLKKGMEVINPLLVDTATEKVATAVIGTAKGDLHDIGKNIVGMFLEGAGFEVIDLGVDVYPEKFIEVTKEKNAKLICISALLTTTMTSMNDVVKLLKGSEDLRDVKTLIGGAPINEQYARKIEADGYAPNAARAAEKAKELLGIA